MFSVPPKARLSSAARKKSGGGGGGGVPLSSIVYSQSSVYSANVAASVANMQDNNKDTGTGVNPAAVGYIALDMGQLVTIDRIIVSAPGPNLPGGWGGAYIGSGGWQLQVSSDNVNWTAVAQNTVFAQYEQKTFNVSTTCRYVRHGYLTNQQFYLACSEFYPLAPGQAGP